jgi:hypothetical protein
MSQMLTSGHRSSSREEFLVTFLSLHHMILSGQLLNSSLLLYPKSTLTNNTLPDDDGDDNGPPGIRDDMCEGLLTLSFQGAIGAPDEGFPAIACRFPRLNNIELGARKFDIPRLLFKAPTELDGKRRNETTDFGFSSKGLILSVAPYCGASVSFVDVAANSIFFVSSSRRRRTLTKNDDQTTFSSRGLWALGVQHCVGYWYQ